LRHPVPDRPATALDSLSHCRSQALAARGGSVIPPIRMKILHRY
jgi:hypothetical protein